MGPTSLPPPTWAEDVAWDMLATVLNHAPRVRGRLALHHEHPLATYSRYLALAMTVYPLRPRVRRW